MKKTYKRVPFDIELAKKIQSGEVEGRIVTSKLNNRVRILCDDLVNTLHPEFRMMCAILRNEVEYVLCFRLDGTTTNTDEGKLVIEVPEEAPKQEAIAYSKEEAAAYKTEYECGIEACEKAYKYMAKKETPKHEFKVGDVVTFFEGELKGCCGVIREINSNGNIVVTTYSGDVLTSAKRILKGYNYEEKHKFKPFDKVLVRDISGQWSAAYYSHYDKEEDKHSCGGVLFDECIPYNEHLVGTTDDPE